MKTALLFAALAVGAMGVAHAGDIEVGKDRYTMCASCHLPSGAGQAIFPPVAGKDVGYLVDVMTRYRAGEQVGPNTMMMAPHVRMLSDEDIANLAAYMATLK
jgi:cytochrome c